MLIFCGRYGFILTTALLFLSVVETQSSASDFIINVDFVCPKDVTGKAKVTVVTDIPATVPFAYCRDPFTYYYMETNKNDDFEINVSFDGSDLNGCVFTKADSAKIYTVEVYVPMAGGIFTSEDLPHLVTCSYEDTAEQKSPPQQFSDSVVPIDESLHNMGTLGKSDVNLYLQDIVENKVNSSVALGNFIRLVADLKGNWKDEVSFQAISCKAVSKTDQYSILVGGCGDGIVISRKKGFSTKGKRVLSPFFKSFRLRGQTSVSFDCTFAICNKNCDGDSCPNNKHRRRRDVRYIRVLPNGSVKPVTYSDLLVTEDNPYADRNVLVGKFNKSSYTGIIGRKIDPLPIASLSRSSNKPTIDGDAQAVFRIASPQKSEDNQKSDDPHSPSEVGVWLIMGISLGFSFLLVIIMVLITRRILALLHSLVTIATENVDYSGSPPTTHFNKISVVGSL